MTDKHQSRPSPSRAIERGTFTDGHSTFAVRASSAEAPDSFQVSANDNPADIVLIVSGLNSGNLHATWGQPWRTYAPDWKVWIEDSAFEVFYNGHHITNRPNKDGGLGEVRICNG